MIGRQVASLPVTADETSKSPLRRQRGVMVYVSRKLVYLAPYRRRTRNSVRLGKYRTLGSNSCKVAARDTSAAGKLGSGYRILAATRLRSVVALHGMSCH